MSKKSRKQSKSQKVMMHLLKGKTLNQAQAAKLFGAWRLSAIIFNLRKKGFDIITTQNSRGIYKGFGRYQMTKTPTGQRIKAN
jgi:hypothetical protein